MAAQCTAPGFVLEGEVLWVVACYGRGRKRTEEGEEREA